MMKHTLRLFAFLLLLSQCTFGSADNPSFDKDLQPFLNTNCVRCHNAKKQEGEFSLDALSKDVGTKDTPLWAEVMERINSGEMPPEDEKVRPTADQSAAIVEWIAARIREGEAVRMARRDRVSYNRLTREEYVNTMRDLIGVQYDAEDPGGLLEDPEWNGFERLGSVLTLSATHVEKYIKAAEIVLSEAYPETKIEYLEASTRASVLNEKHPHYARLAKAGLLDKVRFPLTTSGELYRGSNPYRGPDARFPGPGVYEISYTVCGLKPENGPAPRIQVYEHKLDRVLFEQDVIAPEDKLTTVTFRVHFPAGGGPNIHVINKAGGRRHPRTNAGSQIPFITTAYPRAPWQMKITDQQGRPRYPILIIDSITMRGPIVTEQEQNRRIEYMAQEDGNMQQVRTGLAAMAKRAFRRPLYDNEVNSFVGIVEDEVAAGEKFRDAVKSAMTAILCSKSFLFISEGDENSDRHTLNDWEIAARLSYLLWSTMPDEELFSLAEQGKLRDREQLQRQVTRMLADPRAERFTKSFASQWLQLRKVGMFPPDKKIYPNYDQHLEKSMVGETQAFFKEVLDKGLT
jgi:hypothetical protein